MIIAKLWTSGQCNNGGNVSAHYKHAHMCKLQPFTSLGLLFGFQMFNSAIQSSNQQLFIVCAGDARLLLSRMALDDSAPLRDGRVNDRLVQPLPFFNYVFLQLTNISNLLFYTHFFASLPIICQKTFSAKILLHILLSGKDLIKSLSSVLNTIIGAKYLLMSQIQH